MKLVSVLVVAGAATLGFAGQPPAPPPDGPFADTAAVRAAVMGFIRAIDRLDVEGVAAAFADDATAFYPFTFTPHRLDGRAAIAAAQARGFELMRERFAAAGQDPPTALNLNPTAMRVQMLGPDAAVVTWHSDRPTHAGRRTSVMQRVGGRWLMVSHHASNVDREAP